MKNFLFGIVLAYIALFSIAIDANLPDKEVIRNNEPVFHKVEAVTPNTNKPDKDVVEENIPTYTNIDGFIEYLNETFDYQFNVVYRDENYHDDYLDMDIDEYAYISCEDSNNKEIMAFAVSYLDNKLIDITITINVSEEDDFGNYQKEIHTILAYATDNKFADEYFEFNKYSDNTYGNKQYVFFNETCCGSGVIFEGGKDYSFNGTSYFFTATIH